MLGNNSWNEWLVYIACFVSLIVYFFLRKKFPIALTIVIWVFVVSFVETVDFILALTPYDLYDFMDTPKYELGTALQHIFVYPVSSLVFLFFYEKWQISGGKLVGYLLLWLTFSLGIEWLAEHNGVLTYKRWKMLYSIPTYPVASLILIWVYHFAKKHLNVMRPF